MLAQSPEQEAHDKLLDNNPDQFNLTLFWKYWFLEERGKPEYLEKNLFEQGRVSTINSAVHETNPGHIGGS